MTNYPDLSWGLRCLQVDALWRAGLTGAGVRLGHLDTGLDGDHPALAGRIAAFQAFDRDGTPLPDEPPADSRSHGTRTASLLCGGFPGAAPLGAAPGTSLYSGRVLEGGSALIRVLMGMAWLVECRVRVACLPLGVAGCSPVFASMIAAMRQANLLPVARSATAGPGERSPRPATQG